MMQTGPVVTLQVAKLGASYHGLGALLSEPTSEQKPGTLFHLSNHRCFKRLLFRPRIKTFFFLASQGDESLANSNGKSVELYSVVDAAPSEHHGGSRRKKEQIMQRNRQLYRSNPNMTRGCTSIFIT